MKTKYTLFRRGTVYYSQDSATGKQTSLRTKDETEARSLLNARNEAQRQPVLEPASGPRLSDRQRPRVCRTHLADRHGPVTGTRPGEQPRTLSPRPSSRPPWTACGTRNFLETTADDFFAVFQGAKPSTICFLKRLHHLALSAGWIALPIVAPNLWPRYKPKDRRGITLDEHQTLLAKEKKAEWKLFLELLWETGAAQSDAVNFKAEDIDWPTRTLSYFRQKTGSLAQFTISKALEKVLEQLPTTGVLFPNLSTHPANFRANSFAIAASKQGCRA